jgi:hypothetical protein
MVESSFHQRDFNIEESATISRIPLSSYKQPDTLIWRGTTIGEFTVWSAYHLEKEVHDHMIEEGSTSKGCSGIWKLIWSLNLPNATKMLFWRACYIILPTKENLLKRGIVKEPFCPICGLDVESLVHILWSCHRRWMYGEPMG